MTRELKRFAEHLGRPLDTATRADCEGFIAQRVAVSIYSANYLWRALRSFYGFLAEEDGLANPVKNTKAPKVPEPATKVATEDEYRAMLAAVRARMPVRTTRNLRMLRGTFETRRDQALLAALWATGLRRSELSRLSVNDVDTGAQRLIVRKSKTGRPRIVPITPEATKALLQYLRLRAHHRHADSLALWLGHKGAMTSDGIPPSHRAHRQGCGRGRVSPAGGSTVAPTRETSDRGLYDAATPDRAAGGPSATRRRRA